MAPLSEFYSDPPAIPDSLWHIFDAASKDHASNTAMTVMHQSAAHLSSLRSPSSPPMPAGGRCLQWTFSDLRHASLLLARGFHTRGVHRGSTMVTLVANGIECVLLLWVSAILQLTFAPLDVKLLDPGREEQLRDYMRRLKPAVVVVPEAEGGRAVDAALLAVDARAGLKVSLAESNVSYWRELVGISSSESESDEAILSHDEVLDQNGDRVAILLFTSGTSTGRPKGCPRTVRNLLSANVGEFAFLNIPQKSVVHTPNSGAIVQAFLLLFGSTGREIIIPGPFFSPAGALDAVEQYGAQMMVAIPVMSRMFEKEMSAQERDLSALREIAIGGDMVTSEAKEKFEQLFPTARVVLGHGMTEAISMLGWRGHALPEVYPQYHNILAIGYAQPGSCLRICDEQGKVVPRGEAGEIHFGGPCVIDHYLENDQPENFYCDERGSWMLTGDRALMSEDGVITIIGRIKDIIKRVGLSMSPAVVESVLNRMDGVEVGRGRLTFVS